MMNQSEVIKEFKRVVSTLNWELDFLSFCQLILGVEKESELLQQDKYCLNKWQQWQSLTNSLNAFDDETIERILRIYSERKTN